MNFLSEHRDQHPALIKKQAEPAHVPGELKQQQDNATVGVLRRFWYALKGYTLDDIRRLKDAAVSMTEGKAGEQIGKAMKLEAEAAKIHAEAETVKQENAAKELQNQRERLAVSERETDEIERRAAALERLVKAIQILKINGGAIFLDGDQIENELKKLGQLPRVEIEQEEKEGEDEGK